MKPSLHWSAYKATADSLRFAWDNRELLTILASNKRIDIDSLRKIPFVKKTYNGSLEIILEQLRKDEFVLERMLPAEFAGRVDELTSFYSINWKMIKAVNKAISRL